MIDKTLSVFYLMKITKSVNGSRNLWKSGNADSSELPSHMLLVPVSCLMTQIFLMFLESNLYQQVVYLKCIQIVILNSLTPVKTPALTIWSHISKDWLHAALSKNKTIILISPWP